MRVVWTPLAITRVTEIARYIAEDRPVAAERWVAAIFKRTTVLSRFPQTGGVVSEVGRTTIREIHHGDYRIIYRVDPKRIAILAVRHGRRLLEPTELEEGEQPGT